MWFLLPFDAYDTEGIILFLDKLNKIKVQSVQFVKYYSALQI